MIGHTDIVVYTLDIGVYNTGAAGQVLATTTAAWCRLESGVATFDGLQHERGEGRDIGRFAAGAGDEFTCKCGRNIARLRSEVLADLQAGRKVAMGFEAPMWLPIAEVEQPNHCLFPPRFPAERGREWYLQSGAAATVKAIPLGKGIIPHVAQAVPPLCTTTQVAAESWHSNTLLLFEGYVAGDYKVDVPPGCVHAPNEWDAFLAALAWGARHAGFETPDAYEPRSLYPDPAGWQGDSLSVWDVIWGHGIARSSGWTQSNSGCACSSCIEWALPTACRMF